MGTKKNDIKDKVMKILSPIESNEDSESSFFFNRCRIEKRLPSYYLVYFLFADLLDYRNLGPWEKRAWSFPIKYKGEKFTIEHRKLGLGVFSSKPDEVEKLANELVTKIKSAVKVARPFFDQIAEEGVNNSELNVTNHNRSLFERYEYLNNLYHQEFKLYEEKKDKQEVEKGTNEIGEYTSYKNLGLQHYKNANHLAISAIDAFFSWTEHLFVHLAIIHEGTHDGQVITKLIGAEWKTKFQAAITLEDKTLEKFYHELTLVRQQLRNFVAHGAFGKKGNAFTFHSGAGAVPVLMEHNKNKNRFSLQGHLGFDNGEVINMIESFIQYIWSTELGPALKYTQEFELPTILTMAKNGIYAEAIKSNEEMEEFAHGMMRHLDDSANMDW